MPPSLPARATASRVSPSSSIKPAAFAWRPLKMRPSAKVLSCSSASLRLPGVVYRPLESNYLREIELSCLYRRSDDSPVLSAFVAVMRDFAAQAASPKARPAAKQKN